jgi:hypothetical protein
MTIGGYDKRIDYERLGPTMMIAASIIIAIRTAKRLPGFSESLIGSDCHSSTVTESSDIRSKVPSK